MNNRGFTLVELLATIVIVGVVMGIATYNIFATIEKSKKRSEKLFVNELDGVVRSYISYNRGNWEIGPKLGDFEKCRVSSDDGESCLGDEKRSVSVYKSSVAYFLIDELANDKYIQNGKIVNPKNKLDCLKDVSDEDKPKVFLYRDDDAVYYYYVSLQNLSCELDDSNLIVTNISKKLCSVLSSDGFSWDSDKNECIKG